MANSDKNIRITTSRNKTTFPNIVFTGSSAGSSVITLNILDDNTMSFESSEGQVFSLDSNLSTGTIWGVSDISGIPLLRASAGATIGLAEYSGFVGIGTNIPTYKLHVRGLAAFASTADQTLSFIFDTSLSAGSANLQVRRGNSIRFYASGDSLYTALKAATTNTYTLTLPPSVPASGSTFLTSDTSGNMAWVNISSIGLATTSQNTNTVSANSNSTHYLIFSPQNGASGVALSSGIGLTYNPVSGLATLGGTAVVNQRLTVGSTLDAASKSDGAFVLSGGAGIAKSLFIGGALYTGGGTFSKSGVSLGDIVLDNTTNDTGGILYYYKNNTNFGIDVLASGSGSTRYRIVKDLNEAGGAELWSIDRSGVVTRTAWDVGETINTKMYDYTSLGMSATTTINSTTFTAIATTQYTPKSSTSFLWIEFNANYDFNDGTTTDDFWSRIMVDGSEVAAINQRMVGQVGGGTRSGTLFPISARYTNSTTSGIAITIQAKWGSADDNIRVYGSSTSGYMRIQEIGR